MQDRGNIFRELSKIFGERNFPAFHRVHAKQFDLTPLPSPYAQIRNKWDNSVRKVVRTEHEKDNTVLGIM